MRFRPVVSFAVLMLPVVAASQQPDINTIQQSRFKNVVAAREHDPHCIDLITDARRA